MRLVRGGCQVITEEEILKVEVEGWRSNTLRLQTELEKANQRANRLNGILDRIYGVVVSPDDRTIAYSELPLHIAKLLERLDPKPCRTAEVRMQAKNPIP